MQACIATSVADSPRWPHGRTLGDGARAAKRKRKTEKVTSTKYGEHRRFASGNARGGRPGTIIPLTLFRWYNRLHEAGYSKSQDRTDVSR